MSVLTLEEAALISIALGEIKIGTDKFQNYTASCIGIGLRTNDGCWTSIIGREKTVEKAIINLAELLTGYNNGTIVGGNYPNEIEHKWNGNYWYTVK